jgi:hypothetical protein
MAPSMIREREARQTSADSTTSPCPGFGYRRRLAAAEVSSSSRARNPGAEAPSDERQHAWLSNSHLLDELANAAVQGIVAAGSRRECRVSHLGGTGVAAELAISGMRCAEITGYDVHADTSARALERERREILVKYLARPPIADDGVVVVAGGANEEDADVALPRSQRHAVDEGVVGLAVWAQEEAAFGAPAGNEVAATVDDGARQGHAGMSASGCVWLRVAFLDSRAPREPFPVDSLPDWQVSTS